MSVMPSAATQLFRIITRGWLNWLLLAAPFSLWLRWTSGVSIWVFVTAAVSLIPAAGLIGTATEHLARRAGPTLGGFLNATFGNAAELDHRDCRASRPPHSGRESVDYRQYHRQSTAGLRILVFRGRSSPRPSEVQPPFGRVVHRDVVSRHRGARHAGPCRAHQLGSLEAHPAVIDTLSFWSSIVLLGVYAAGLSSHSDRSLVILRHRSWPCARTGPSRRPRTITLLALATAFTAVEAEVLVESLEPALKGLGMTELFAGVIVVALVGNAAEHYSAVTRSQ